MARRYFQGRSGVLLTTCSQYWRRVGQFPVPRLWPKPAWGWRNVTCRSGIQSQFAQYLFPDIPQFRTPVTFQWCNVAVRNVTLCHFAFLRPTWSHLTNLFSDVASTQSHITGIFTNQPSLLPHVPVILTYITQVQPAISILQPDVSALFPYEPVVQPHVSAILPNITRPVVTFLTQVFPYFTHGITVVAEIFPHITNLLASFTSILPRITCVQPYVSRVVSVEPVAELSQPQHLPDITVVGLKNDGGSRFVIFCGMHYI